MISVIKRSPDEPNWQAEQTKQMDRQTQSGRTDGGNTHMNIIYKITRGIPGEGLTRRQQPIVLI